MAEYQTGGHTKHDIKYDLVWITKYRYKILRGEVAERARELIRQTCQMREVQIVRGAVSADHVHMLVIPALLCPRFWSRMLGLPRRRHAGGVARCRAGARCPTPQL